MKAITTKFHEPTNTKPSRYSATDCDGNRVIVSAVYSPLNHDLAAIALCRKMGWTGKLVSGGTKTGNVYVFLPPSLTLAGLDPWWTDSVIDLDAEVTA